MITTLSEALAERGFDTLTDVQTAVSAPELADADLLVSAQTGSGKTVGFGLAIAQTLMGETDRLGPAAAPLALVVAPTRELALQVERELTWLYAKAGARVVPCIGGMDARQERRALDHGAHIVVGTPGRLRDHITRGALELTDIRAVVLDEADEMLDLGFREDLEFMLAAAPETRRTLMFSATVPPAIAEMAKAFQRDAVRVNTGSGARQHADIAYRAVQVAPQDGENAIINLLRFHDAPTAIVFANTRAAVARLTARISNRGLSVVSLSGELSQDERGHALQAMRDGRARVCVATDVAARGIDLPNLALVIHADLPTNTEALLHRSGRTGRAGRKGISALIVPDKASKKAARLLKWAKIEAEWVTAPDADEILRKDEQRLLDDPAWSEEPTEDEAAFAATLMEMHDPARIAVACLKLYRARLSAPEELNTRGAPGKEVDRAPFGPSAWVVLSVGRDKNAEPRWLLPLLCRAGGLEKSQIGKIRVEAKETQVELTAAALPGFLERLGAGGVLEGDVTAKAADGADQSRSEAPKPRSAAPRPAPQRPAPEHPAPMQTARPKSQEEPRPPKAGKPTAPRPGPKGPRPEGKGPRADSKGPRPEGTERPRPNTADERPKRAASKHGGAPGASSRPKSAGPGAKPKGPPSKPGLRAGASDTSKRMERPGKPRPGGKKSGPPQRGGDAKPRRKG